jgi:ABC-type nitrate/sulfonate/bicarbonate transport system substrate-binding protein
MISRKERKAHKKDLSPKDFMLVRILSLVFVFLMFPEIGLAQQEKKPLEKVRLAVAAKALTLLPYYFGKSKGLFEREGIDLEIIAMRPPVGVTALQAGEVDYGGSTGVALRGAIKGLPLKAYMFIQTRLSFTLVGQPGMTPARMRNIAVSGIGSLAHTAAITVARRLGRDGPNDRIVYLATNTTPSSFQALTAKAVDAAILTPPYTSMATLAGYVDLGDTFDVRDLQGGIVGRVSHVQNHREQMKAMIRAVLRSTEIIIKNEAEVVAYIQKDFSLEQKVAVDSYKILLKVLNPDGDIDDTTLKSIIDKIRQESGLAAEIPADRLVDLTLLREVKAELRKK